MPNLEDELDDGDDGVTFEGFNNAVVDPAPYLARTPEQVSQQIHHPFLHAARPLCPHCGSAEVWGYDGIMYGTELSYESVRCESCGTKFNVVWARVGIADVETPQEASE